MRLIEPAIFRSAYRSFTASWTETKMISEKRALKLKYPAKYSLGPFVPKQSSHFYFLNSWTISLPL